MTAKKALVSVLKILAVCFVFALCFMVGGALSGLDKIGQQAASSNTVQPVASAQQAASSASEVSTKQQPPQMLENFLPAFLTISICVGVVLSYLILRSNWHGWTLVAALCLAMYGLSTVATQIESVFFLSNKLPQGMIRAIFLQGAIATALFVPLAVLLLGKWRTASQAPASPAPARLSAPSVAGRLALIVTAFVFLYMFFGYYVAWQSPAVRQYYGGPEQPTFYAALKDSWMHNRSIYPLQVLRALLYAACLYPLIRMLRAGRWETTLAMALFLSVWTTLLLLPNPLMPSAVAHAHFRETLAFSLVFGAIAGWLLYPLAHRSLT